MTSHCDSMFFASSQNCPCYSGTLLVLMWSILCILVAIVGTSEGFSHGWSGMTNKSSFGAIGDCLTSITALHRPKTVAQNLLSHECGSVFEALFSFRERFTKIDQVLQSSGRLARSGFSGGIRRGH